MAVGVAGTGAAFRGTGISGGGGGGGGLLGTGITDRGSRGSIHQVGARVGVAVGGGAGVGLLATGAAAEALTRFARKERESGT